MEKRKGEAMKRQSIITVLLAVALGVGASGEGRPFFQASLTPDCAIYESSERIEGLALSLWGENPQAALALGLVNGSSGESCGVSIGVMNYAESYAGVQWAFANFTSGDTRGWQGGPLLGLLVSVLNYTGGSMSGFQAGVVNMAGKLSGLQFGLINYTREADNGLQIGLVNLISQNTAWFKELPQEMAPGMILANWRF